MPQWKSGLAAFLAFVAGPAPAQDWVEGFPLAGGANHALVIREGGQLWGFGLNQSAALGAETNDFPAYSTNRFISYRIGAESDWRWIESMGDSNGTTFAIRENGGLWAWGNNSSGQLGDGTGASRKTPARIAPDQTWRSVSARAGSVFAVRSDGTLWAWGRNEPGSGALGIGRGRAGVQFSPVQVGTNANWRLVQASLGSVLVVTNQEQFSVTNSNGVVTNITTNVVRTFAVGRGGAGLRGAGETGEIWGWGSALVSANFNGPNLIGVPTNFVPVRVGTKANWRQLVFAHDPFALQAEEEGAGLTLWKYNVTGDFEAFPSATNPAHLGWKTLRGAQTGEGTNARGHVVGVKTNGTLWAWGDNRQGQVDPQLNAQAIQEDPWQITGIDGVEDDGWSEVAAGPGHSLALTKAGQVFTWGSLGFTPPGVQRIPVRVKWPAQATEPFVWKWALAGADFSMATDQDGTLYGWGVTGMANPSLAVARTPRPLDAETNHANPSWSSTGWTQGVAVIGRSVAAIQASQDMKIWGDSEETEYQAPWWNPLRVEEGIRDLGTSWIQVAGSRGLLGSGTNTNVGAVSTGFGLAVKADGSLWSWGDNSFGQLGDGTQIPKDTPQRIGNERGWTGVAAGGRQALAFRRDGSLWGWGANSNGELGLTTPVVTVSNLFSGGTNDTNATNARPRVYAGRVQTTTVLLASNVQAPRLILGRGWGVQEVSAGASHTLFLRNDQSLWAMGANDFGQLGLGSVFRPNPSTNAEGGSNLSASNWIRTSTVTKVVTNINFAPWRVETNTDILLDQAWIYRPQRVGQKTWKAVSAGERHSLAVRTDGTLWAWGDNSSAQLGIGNLVSTNQPVQVGAANRWVQAYAGKEHSLGLQRDGSLWAWGKNDGRLGIDADGGGGSPFHELSFGQNVQGTLTLESGGRGTNRILGTGLVRFEPRASHVTVILQLDAPGRARTEWSGRGGYRAARHFLAFSNLTVSPAAGSGGETNREASGQFILREMKSGWFFPGTFSGTAVVNGTNCRATLLFDGDADRDGIPDGADISPKGSRPILSNKMEIRIRVGEETNVYETPGLGEGIIPILSSDLSDLPDGLTYAEGKIQGTPTREAVGVHEVVVGAANEAGESYQTLRIEVVPPDPLPAEAKERIPWIFNSGPFTHTIAVLEGPWNTRYPKFPLEFRGQNIPPGLVLERGTGVLRGAARNSSRAPDPGLYRMTYTITHRGGGSALGVLVVESQRRGTVGVPFRFQVRLGGNGPIEITPNLPMGLKAIQGVIQGTPKVAGEFPVTARQRSGAIWLEESVILAVDPAEGQATTASPMANAGDSAMRTGWPYPAIFSLGPLASQAVEGNGRIRNLSSPIRNYSLQWTNVEGWKWDHPASGLAVGLQDAETALRKTQRAEVRRLFPAAVRLAQISYASGRPGPYLPTNHVFWLKNMQGKPLATSGTGKEWWLDFSQPEFVQRLGERVRFLIQSGCVDGVYLPEWDENSLWPTGSVPVQGQAGESQASARVLLLKSLREAVGPRGWIVAEAAGSSWSLTGPTLDGIHLVAATEPPPSWPPLESWWPDPYAFRESGAQETLWERVANSLQAFGRPGVLRQPGMVALELWARYSPQDLRTQPARFLGLAMSLCLSDGAFLYASPDWWRERNRQVEPGSHVWYAEWAPSLGRPIRPVLLQPDDRGLYQREFEHGWAVYAPAGLSGRARLEFPEAVRSLASGKIDHRHEIQSGHGDLFLKNQ